VPIMTDVTEPLPRLWMVRWRFDFAAKPTKYGLWGRPGETKEVQAWCNNGEGLLRASIEGKQIVTREQKLFAECDGHSFVNFKWIAAAGMPAFAKGYGEAQLRSRIVGLTLVVRDNEIHVYDTGQIIVSDRTEEDKNYHYATFGR